MKKQITNSSSDFQAGCTIPPSYLFAEMQERISVLQQILRYATDQLDKLPEGKIHVAPGHNNHNFRYYVKNEDSKNGEQYLKKEQAELKSKLSQKRYLEEVIRRGSIELDVLEKASRRINCDSLIASYIKMGQGIRKMIHPIILDDESYIAKWQNAKYEGLGFGENDRTEYYSERGERMRSKSEVMIANMLFANHIPYKYECPVERINGENIYPDFTVLDIKRRRTVYWEHLGRIGDLSYVSKNLWKLDEYKKVGIILGIDLFITYESEFCPLGTKEIKKMVEMFR